MAKIRQFMKRSSLFMMALGLFGAWVLGDVALFVGRASAAQITSRSLTISSSANGTISVGNPGDGGNGQEAQYDFSFTLPTSGNVGSVLFQVCTTPLPSTTCTSPTGFTAENVSTINAGGSFAGFTVDTTTDLTGSPYSCDNTTGPAGGRVNCIAITDGTPGALTGAVTASFGGNSGDFITNPSNDNDDFFVRITTYSDAAYATTVDQGTVATSTAEQIDITAKVQEVLNFSVGAPGAGNVPAPGTTCAPFTDDGALDLGDSDGVLSFSQAYDAHSYFRVSTNANNGTSISYSGDTLTLVGSSTQITPVDNVTAEVSAPGTEQFGLAVDSGDTETNGFTFNTLTATAPYEAGDGSIDGSATPQEATFAFDPASVTAPVEIASSTGAVGDKTIVCDTGSVRYLGNVSTTTSAGIYTTTITFIAAPTY